MYFWPDNGDLTVPFELPLDYPLLLNTHKILSEPKQNKIFFCSGAKKIKTPSEYPLYLSTYTFEYVGFPHRSLILIWQVKLEYLHK